MTGGIGMADNFLKPQDLKIGMKISAEQLTHIMDKYMILAYDNYEDTEGTLVFIGDEQTSEYNRWFSQDKPITPIHHTKMELEENVVYDE